MESSSAPTYSSMLSGKGALLNETVAVLAQIDDGRSIDQVRTMVMDHDLLSKITLLTRWSVWKQIHVRYLSDGERARVLARMVVHAPDRQTERLVLFYELCRSSPILHDTTIRCVYPRYAAGYSGIDKTHIHQHFDDISAEHPELMEWSPQTRDKVASNILTIARDFGLLEGAQRKQFSHLYVPLPAFVYVLYRLAGDGLTTPREILEAEEWRLFLLESADVMTLLDEATKAAHCDFKHRGDVHTIDLHYPSLEVCVEVLTGQV